MWSSGLRPVMYQVSASCRKTAGSKPGREHELFLVVSSCRELAHIGVLTAVGVTVTVFPHTNGLQYAKESTQAYENDSPVPVPSKIHNMFLEVKRDLLACASSLPSHDITHERLDSIKPYTVFGFEMFNLGWLRSEYGCWLGVPEYFKYFDGCPPSNRTKVNNRPVPWQEPAGQKLKDSLSISDDAKQFAIARETLLICQDEPDKCFVHTLGNLSLSAAVARSLYLHLNLSAHPLVVTGIMYSVVFSIGASFWFVLNDYLAVQAERTADSAAALLGERYVRAGVEYCDSIVRRNQALRDLMGKDGDSIYTACGNEQTSLRMRHVPIVERLNFFKEKLDAINSQSSETKSLAALEL
ncbi:hypothetical protein FHG87_010165 [Trinorchestia longiramus]|nr:hypothetical protein FHG87_010165 [Trinorchestia longiramus]